MIYKTQQLKPNCSMKANHVEGGEFVDEEQVHLSLRTPCSCPMLGDALYGNASTTFL